MKYKIPVSWMQLATMEVEAESLEEAIEKADQMELPEDGEYLDGSFEVNYGCIEELNKHLFDTDIELVALKKHELGE